MKSDYAQTVADSIIQQLKEGTAPWIKPWEPGERFLPYNPITGNHYRGINAIWLLSVAERKGYTDQRWMTYKQAESLGAQVQRGEKGTPIQYWKWSGTETLKDANGKAVLDTDGKPMKIDVQYAKPLVLSAVVFNAQQVAGLENTSSPSGFSITEQQAKAEQILINSQAKIEYQLGNRAYYTPALDRIVLPERQQFPTAEGFYQTALHELGHWTGHASRLNRDLSHPFGSEGYAKEELRAEIASLMLGEKLGIGHDPGQHVAYVKSWIQVLAEEPRELFRASSDAEKIMDYVLKLELTQTLVQTPEEKTGRELFRPSNESSVISEDDRVYIDVPFVEKREAKALGAQWSKENNSWYIHKEMNVEPFSRWLKENKIELRPQEEFANALREAGLILKQEPIMDGNVHRVAVQGDRFGATSGSYVGFLDGRPAGYYQNFKTGAKSNWKSGTPMPKLTAEERAKLLEDAIQKSQEREEKRQTIQNHTKGLVLGLWGQAGMAGEHPYLKAKGVMAFNIKENTVGSLQLSFDGTPGQSFSNKGDLLVPIQDVEGNLWSAQSISPEGQKSFPKGGRIEGLFCLLGELKQDNKPLLLAEGYATGATLHEATGLSVAICFHAGNMPHAAKEIRKICPERMLVMAGDNDHHKVPKDNVGKLKAEEAAKEVNGHVLLPSFSRESQGTDWNDLMKEQGKEAVVNAVRLGLQLAMRQERRHQQAALKTEAVVEQGKALEQTSCLSR